MRKYINIALLALLAFGSLTITTANACPLDQAGMFSATKAPKGPVAQAPAAPTRSGRN